MSIRQLQPPNLARSNILIIEDFEGMRIILRDMLDRAGASRIVLTANAAMAINQLERQRFDIILCDLHLGPGKNGQDILEEARHRALLPPEAVWLMVSSEKEAEMVTGTVESRPDDYLIKPITETLLYSRLSRQIAKKQALAPMSDEEPSDEDGVVRVSVRERSGAIVEAVGRLGEAGVEVDDLALRRPTLDDVFLTLTGRVAEEATSTKEAQ